MAAKSAQPWRASLAMRPYVKVRPAGMTKMRSIWTRFTSGVGFSNGWELLALKKPPPFVPSILMASWDATGPSAITCFRPSTVRISRFGARVCTTPWETRNSATRKERGRRT